MKQEQEYARRAQRGMGADAAALLRLATLRRERKGEVEVVVIGVSTGGPSVLETMLPRLPKEFPVPVLIVQHMPKLFTGALAERLNRICALHVREAFGGAKVMPGTIWLAPGDAHMELARDACGFAIALHQETMLNFCRPSVDYLFDSAARVLGPGVLAVVMTGMGADGVEGARAVRAAGGTVLVQDEASSAVWGMPGRVMEAGLAEAAFGIDGLGTELVRRVSGRASEAAEGRHQQGRVYGS